MVGYTLSGVCSKWGPRAGKAPSHFSLAGVCSPHSRDGWMVWVQQFLPDRAPLLTSGGQKKKSKECDLPAGEREIQGRLSNRQWRVWRYIKERGTLAHVLWNLLHPQFIAALNLLALVNWIASRWRLTGSLDCWLWIWASMQCLRIGIYCSTLKLLNCSSMPFAGDSRDNLWHLHVLYLDFDTKQQRWRPIHIIINS